MPLLAGLISLQLGITGSIKYRKFSRRLQASVTVGYYEGAADAEYDLLSGKRRILVGGMRTMNFDVVQRIYKERLNVDFVDMGCSFTNKGIAHLRGYNETMEMVILKQYGKSRLNEVEKEVRNEINTPRH